MNSSSFGWSNSWTVDPTKTICTTSDNTLAHWVERKAILSKPFLKINDTGLEIFYRILPVIGMVLLIRVLCISDNRGRICEYSDKNRTKDRPLRQSAVASGDETEPTRTVCETIWSVTKRTYRCRNYRLRGPWDRMNESKSAEKSRSTTCVALPWSAALQDISNVCNKAVSVDWWRR